MTPDLEPLLNSVRDAVKTRNWLAGLALAMALPDICGRIQFPRTHSGDRYKKWWRTKFGTSYRYGKAPKDYVTGGEAYLLRCAYLHEGSDVADAKQFKKLFKKSLATIDRFKFVISDHHLKTEQTRVGKKSKTAVLLRAEDFCEDMCSAVEKWDKKVLSKHPKMLARASKLLKIYLRLRLAVEVKSHARITYSKD